MAAVEEAATELNGGPELGNIIASALVGVIGALDDIAPNFKTSIMKRLEEKPN